MSCVTFPWWRGVTLPSEGRGKSEGIPGMEHSWEPLSYSSVVRHLCCCSAKEKSSISKQYTRLLKTPTNNTVGIIKCGCEALETKLNVVKTNVISVLCRQFTPPINLTWLFITDNLMDDVKGICLGVVKLVSAFTRITPQKDIGRKLTNWINYIVECALVFCIFVLCLNVVWCSTWFDSRTLVVSILRTLYVFKKCHVMSCIQQTDR